MRHIGAVAFAAIIGLTVACHGNSPTEPVAPPLVTFPARLTFAISTTSSHTLRSAKMTFDGREVATVTMPLGGGQANLEATVDATRGAHTIRLVVVDQATSGNIYFGSGSITLPDKILDLVNVSKVLATGEALEFNVNI
jgi:hypothetical protein